MSYIRRITVMLTGLTGGALALGAAASPALAVPPPPKPGGTTVVPPPAIHTVVIGGMPGWQITLIAVGAALLAAALAVLADRMRAARRVSARA
jgi:hypothetical protein